MFFKTKIFHLNDTSKDMVLFKNYKDGKTVKINLSAYSRYMKYRTSNYFFPYEDAEISNDLVGKKIKDKITNKEDKIVKVLRDWYGGFYYVIFTEKNSSIAWKNVNCISSVIESDIKENQERFEIV